jgi:hypothetical protein
VPRQQDTKEHTMATAIRVNPQTAPAPPPERHPRGDHGHGPLPPPAADPDRGQGHTTTVLTMTLTGIAADLRARKPGPALLGEGKEHP